MPKLMQSIASHIGKVPALWAVIGFLSFALLVFSNQYVESDALAATVVTVGISGVILIWTMWPHSLAAHKAAMSQSLFFFGMFFVHVTTVILFAVNGAFRITGYYYEDNQDYFILLLLFSWIISAYYLTKAESQSFKISIFLSKLLAIYFFPIGAFFLSRRLN